MENSYGVGVVNRYAFFMDDESDPLDAIKAQEQAKELKKKAKEAEKENKGKPEAKPKSVIAPPRKGIKETQNVKFQDSKGGDQKSKPNARPNIERNTERPPPRRREDRPQNGPSEMKEGGGPRPPRRENNDRDRDQIRDRDRDRDRKPNYERRTDGEGGERRPPRGPPRDRERDRERERDGPRPPRTFEGRGKREFDRRSGSDKTGIKPVDKREGGGAHNWGTHKDEIEDLNKTGSEGSGGEERAEGAVPVTGEVPPEGEKPKDAEPEGPRELTLDEYKALKSASRAKPQYNLRKAGEGEDLTQWKNMVALEKKKEAEGEEGDTDEEYDMADYPQRVGRQKRVLGIEFTFNDSSRRGGGGRGRGRGRGGRGAPGGGAPGGRPPRERDERERDREREREREREDDRSAGRHAPPPKVDDSKDFPSLG